MIKEKHGKEYFGKGVVFGKLIGGCIDTIIKIKTKDFFPKLEQWKNTIIFLETSEKMVLPDFFENT